MLVFRHQARTDRRLAGHADRRRHGGMDPAVQVAPPGATSVAPGSSATACTVSAGEFCRRDSARAGMATADIPAASTYDGPYPQTSATRPRSGWAQTPPVEAIRESKERMVARCRDGIMPFM